MVFTEILVYLLWICAGFNIYMALLTYKRCRDLDRSYHLYNRQSEIVVSLENQAMEVAGLGVYAFLKGGDERAKYDFMSALQEYNRKLEQSGKEFM